MYYKIVKNVTYCYHSWVNYFGFFSELFSTTTIRIELKNGLNRCYQAKNIFEVEILLCLCQTVSIASLKYGYITFVADVYLFATKLNLLLLILCIKCYHK